MDLAEYKNNDGTYTSPKNGKIYKSEKALRSHLTFRKTELFHNFSTLHSKKVNCKFCNKQCGFSNITTHEHSCYMNPVNTKHCAVCNKPIKNYKTSKGTCSRACANTLFRSGENNGNWKQEAYQSTCFLYHKKECVVCGEANIVEVHHLDESKDNNDPSNLIPLCPTHHQYWHSRFRHVVEGKIHSYVKEWKEKLGVV